MLGGMPQMSTDLFGNDTPILKAGQKIGEARNKDGSHKFNPMVKAHGPGPADQKCKHCKFSYRRKFSKTYWKCELRGEPKASPANDHRANWPTCGKFEPEFIEAQGFMKTADQINQDLADRVNQSLSIQGHDNIEDSEEIAQGLRTDKENESRLDDLMDGLKEAEHTTWCETCQMTTTKGPTTPYGTCQCS